MGSKTQDTTPTAIFMMGIPASGKSTSIDFMLDVLKLPKDMFINIDPDIFMNRLPGYSHEKACDFNLSGVRISAEILKKIYKSYQKYSFIYFGTGKNYKQYMTMINKAKKNDYRTILIDVRLDVEKAIKRQEGRDRKVSENVIRNTNTKLKEEHSRKRGTVIQTNFEILSELVDEWYIINNENYPPTIENSKLKLNSTILGGSKLRELAKEKKVKLTYMKGGKRYKKTDKMLLRSLNKL